jgi:hypothetical protein
MDQHPPASKIVDMEAMGSPLSIIWRSREECENQALWVEKCGYEVERHGEPAPRADDGTYVYASVLHPETKQSPGALRYRLDS